MKEENNKLSEDMANKEFENWCEANDIDCDETSMTDEDKKAFEPLKEKITKAIKKGICVVDNDKLEYTLEGYDAPMNGMKIVVNPPTGKMYLGMDGYKDTQKFHQLHGAMSAITGLDVGVFAKLKRVDWNFFLSVATLFLTA